MNETRSQRGQTPAPKPRSSWTVAVGALLATAVAGTLFVVWRGSAGRGETLTAEISAGRALYQANCLECHGERALGDGRLAASLPVTPPSLLEHLAHHTEDQLIQLIRAGIPPAMPPPALSEEEVRLVVDYVWTLIPDSERAALRTMQEQMEIGGAAPMPMGSPADSGNAAHMGH